MNIGSWLRTTLTASLMVGVYYETGPFTTGALALILISSEILTHHVKTIDNVSARLCRALQFHKNSGD